LPRSPGCGTYREQSLKGGLPVKPQSIKLFDYFYLGSLFLGLLGFITGLSAIEATLAAQSAENGISISSGSVIAVYVMMLIVSLLLWYLVSFRRWEIAKWAIVVLFLVSLIGVGDFLAGPMPLSEIYSLLSLIANAVAVGLLFRGDATRWLNQKPEQADEAARVETHGDNT
jgi:hypothetical protein